MCHVMYLASDGDLPLVAPTDPPTFSVEMPDRGATGIARQLRLCQLRYLGADTGCSCGFHGAAGSASRARLVAYLGGLPAGRQLQVYDCWEGDWDLPALEHAALAPGDLLLPDAFAERRHITITQEPAP